MANIDDLRTLAQQIKNETTVGANTANRVGTTFEKTVTELEAHATAVADEATARQQADADLQGQINNIHVTVDNVPTKESMNPVASGGVYDELYYEDEQNIIPTFIPRSCIDARENSQTFGEVVNNSEYNATEKIDCSLFKAVRLSFPSTAGAGPLFGLVFYDSEDNPIKGYRAITGASGIIDKTFDVPSEASYFRTSISNRTLRDWYCYPTTNVVYVAQKTTSLKQELDNYQIPKLISNLDEALNREGCLNRLPLLGYKDKELLTIPHLGMTVTLHAPYGVNVRLQYGTDHAPVRNTLLSDGESYTFLRTDVFYRIYAITPATLTPEEIDAMIESNELYLETNCIDEGVVRRNLASERFCKAAMTKALSLKKTARAAKHPVFIHTSDVHGHAVLLNDVLNYSEYLGADAVMATGDFPVENFENGYKYVSDVGTTHDLPFLPCVGNHDAYGASKEGIMERLITPFIEQSGMKHDSSSAAHETYYYSDLSTKNIRVIALDIYDSKYTLDTANNITQAQLDWFVATLLSTPANYGVIVLLHTNPDTIDRIEGKDTFFSTLWYAGSFIQGVNPVDMGLAIVKTIDAFISGTSVNYSFDLRGTTLTVSGDFSGKNSGVEFIAYMAGHSHFEKTGYLHNAVQRQLFLGVTTCNNMYGHSLSEWDDIPRGDGATQDAFNVYAIDREGGVVRIARVGSNITLDGRRRDLLVIPYKL